MRSLFSVFLLSTLLSSCHGERASKTNGYEPVVTVNPFEGNVSRVATSIQLPSLADIPHTVYETRSFADDKEYRQDLGLEDDEEEPIHRNFQQYEVSFDALTEDQFHRLQAQFYKNPELAYDSSKAYSLVDFMPPKIQAMMDLKYRADETYLGDSGFSFSTVTNCWNTAFDVLTKNPLVSGLFYVEEAIAKAFFSNDSYSSFVKRFEISSSTPEDRGSLKPFDAITIYSEYEEGNPILNHVAIYIDQDFYFEKTSFKNWASHRFVPFSAIARSYANNYAIVRRFDKGEIPSAHHIFSMKANGVDVSSVDLDSEALRLFLKDYPNIAEHAVRQSYGQFETIKEAKVVWNETKQRFQYEAGAFEKGHDVSVFKEGRIED